MFEVAYNIIYLYRHNVIFYDLFETINVIRQCLKYITLISISDN